MLIPEDSPLRRLPANLNPRQAQFCDGVRFTAEMADLAYQELLRELEPLSGPSGEADVRVRAARPFLFAWSIIDSAHRLRRLVENFPNLAKKNQSPEFRTFTNEVQPVETLRHTVQHMDERIHESAESGKAVWGTLTWLTQPNGGVLYSCTLVSGAMMPEGKHRIINPAGLTIAAPLDHITLTVEDVAANLSSLMAALGRLVQGIEHGLTEAFKNLPDRAGSDLWIALAMQVQKETPCV
jgi:hypothetical protein